jgi:hypothetical protein
VATAALPVGPDEEAPPLIQFIVLRPRIKLLPEFYDLFGRILDSIPRPLQRVAVAFHCLISSGDVMGCLKPI